MIGPMTSRERVLAALHRQPVDRTPIVNPQEYRVPTPTLTACCGPNGTTGEIVNCTE